MFENIHAFKNVMLNHDDFAITTIDKLKCLSKIFVNGSFVNIGVVLSHIK